MFTHLDDPAPPAPDPHLADAAIVEGRRRLRRRRAAGGGLGAAAVALVVVIGAVQLRADDDRSVIAGTEAPDEVARLAAPAHGEAIADQLADGTPVWIVGHDDGTTTVVDAATAHRPFGVAQLVGWCAAARVFVDPQTGSQYDDRGLVIGGPAPHGLHAVTVKPVDGTVEVAARQLEKRPRRELGSLNQETGNVCLSSEGYTPGFNQGSLVLHDVGGHDPVPLAAALTDAEPGDLLFVRDGTILIRDDGAVACFETERFLKSLPPQCDGIAVRGVAPVEGWAILNGTYLARFRDDSLTDIRYVNGWVARTDDDHGWSGDGIDPDAARWCAPHVGEYGIDAVLIGAFPREDDYEAECWIDGQVGKAPPGGRPYNRAVIGVRADGSAEMIRASYRGTTENMDPRVVEVSGVMQMVGGLVGAEPDPAPGVVTAIDEAGHVVATVETDEQGRFTLRLPSGTYNLTGRSPRYQHGDIDCSASDPVVVGERGVADVEVACHRR